MQLKTQTPESPVSLSRWNIIQPKQSTGITKKCRKYFNCLNFLWPHSAASVGESIIQQEYKWKALTLGETQNHLG